MSDSDSSLFKDPAHSENSSRSHSVDEFSKKEQSDDISISESIYSVSSDNPDKMLDEIQDEPDDFSESEDSSAYVSGGYHPVKIGDIYNDRYRIEAKLGWGYFSTVWLATDFKSNPPAYVAIKFQRSSEAHTEAVYDEIEMLTKVRNEVLSKEWLESKDLYKRILQDNYNKTRGVISYLNFFKVHGVNGVHICVVFEIMGPNILYLIKLYKFRGIPMHLVKKITIHVLLGLDYLHRICGIIHTDLKPENILVSSPPIPPSLPLDSSISIKVEEKNVPSFTVSIKNPELRKDNDTVCPYVKHKIKRGSSDPSHITSYSHPHALQTNLYKHCGHNISNGLMTDGNMNKTGNWLPKHDVPGNSQSNKVEVEPPSTNSKCNKKPNDSNKKHVFVETVEGKYQIKPASREVFHSPESIFKICDLGNSCWIHNHFTDEIQTRQYRSPEAILKCGYCTSADIWSLACVIFELVTGDYLFDPRGSDTKDRDCNHMELIVELLGPIPKNMIKQGKKSKQVLVRSMKNIKQWPIESVLVKKYKLNPKDANELSSFLLCMLKINPEERMPAHELLMHKWLVT